MGDIFSIPLKNLNSKNPLLPGKHFQGARGLNPAVPPFFTPALRPEPPQVQGDNRPDTLAR